MSRAFLVTLLLSGCGRIGFDMPAGDGGMPADGSGPSDGFFVEITANNGSLGGLAQADARCATSLTSGSWLGKVAASSRRPLTASNIHAWLCAAAGCQDLIAGKRYFYASTVNPTRGGASFIATAAGFLDDDGHAFEDPDVFGVDDGFHDYFTGRAQDNTPQPETCGDWLTTIGQTLVAVADTPFYGERLSKYPGQCTDSRMMICFVNPR